MMDRSKVEDPKKRINNSAKRDYFSKKKTSDRRDTRFDNQRNVFGCRSIPHSKNGAKPTMKTIEVSPPKLIGHYQSDMLGKNIVIDGRGGIRVYNFPVERRQNVMRRFRKDSDSVDVVDDWVGSSNTEPPYIPNCSNLDFDVLNGYVPLKDGGNRVSYSGIALDRTAGMKWMIANYQKLKCGDGNRLFDVDFYAGNGAVRSIMNSQFNQHEKVVRIAVILLKGTYYIFILDICEESDDEINNKRSFAGIRFEDFIARESDGEQKGPSSGTRNNYADFIKYHNVVRFNFGKFKMLVTGNVDCVIPGSSAAMGKKPEADDFIEIKTSAPLEKKNDPSSMSYSFRIGKTSSWFAQCILMGIKHVVVGIREEEEGCKKITVNRTHAFTLEQLQRNSGGFWSKDRCFDVLNRFLCVVKEKVIVDDPEVINVFNIQNGLISEPEKKKYADDCVRFPDISEVADLMEKL